MEPHATLAAWHGDELTLYDANQGAYAIHDATGIRVRDLPIRLDRLLRQLG